MSAITLKVPDELAERLRHQQRRLPEILELGLRELNAEVLEFLAGLPSPKEILNLRPSQRLQQRVDELLDKRRTGELTAHQEEEWERYQYLEHLVRMAKAKARVKLRGPARDG